MMMLPVYLALQILVNPEHFVQAGHVPPRKLGDVIR